MAHLVQPTRISAVLVPSRVELAEQLVELRIRDDVNCAYVLHVFLSRRTPPVEFRAGNAGGGPVTVAYLAYAMLLIV